MLAVTLRSMPARARRLLLTVLITSVGVAFIAGTLVFTDTIDAAVHRVFSAGSGGADVVVSARAAISSDPSSGPEISPGILARIRRMQGVRAAAGQVSEVATIVGRDGRPLASGRLPTLAYSYVKAPFRGIRLVQGAPPHGPGQVVVDAGTAARQGFTVGSSVSIVTGQPERLFRVSGIAVLGDGTVGGQRFVVFGRRTAQSLFGLGGAYDRVLVAASPSSSPAALAREIQPALPAGLTARTRAGDATVQARRAEVRLRSLTTGLLAFSLIAIFVGALLVWSSFAAAASGRAMELALLRALGATRAQVLGAVLLEAALVGVLGSVVGLALGPLCGVGARELFDRAASGMPTGGIVLSARTAWVGAAVGVGVAALAGGWSALRASRATPLEALRIASGSRRPGGAGRANRVGRGLLARPLVAAALVLGGLIVIVTASGSAADRLRVSAGAGAAVLVGALVAAPLIVPVMARPLAWILERRNPVMAWLAREQARQNPVRTAVSASSLTIGLALVLLVTVYAGALRAAGRNAIEQTFIGDVAVENQDGVTPIPASAAQAVGVSPGVLGVSALRTARADLGSVGGVNVSGIDPVSWPLMYRFDWVRGSPRTLSRLAVGDILLEQDTARAVGLSVGASSVLRSGSGARVPVRVIGVYRDAGLLPGIVVPAPWFARLFNQPRIQALFVKLAPGSGRPAALASLRGALRRFPGVEVRSERQLADKLQTGVSSIVGLFYALLVLSLAMSLVGITGTLNLSIHERTRELGLLRAVGLSAAHARALVRDESLIAAGVGGITGLALGLMLGWAVTRALAPEGLVFSIPWLGLGAVVLVGLAAGLLAAIPPGRRVTRIDLLAAIAQE